MGVWVVGTVKMMRHVKAVGPADGVRRQTGQRGRASRTSSVRGAAPLDSVHCCFDTESWIFGGVNGAVVGEW